MDLEASISHATTVFLSGNLDQAETACQQGLKDHPGARQLIHLLAVIRDRQGKHAQAITMLQELLEVHGDYVEAAIDLGPMLHRAGAFHAAQQQYISALDHRPGDPLLLFNYGMLLREQKEDQEALKYLRQAVQHKPDYSDALVALANGYRDLDRYDEAAVVYAQAAELIPEDATLKAEIGLMHHLAGEDSKGEKCLLRALELDPDSEIAWLRLAIVRRNLGKLNEAIAHNLKVLELRPHAIEAYNNISQCYQDMAKWDKALEYIDLALEQDPRKIEGIINKANIFKRMGIPDRAVDCLQRALELEPDSIPARLALASTLRRLGQSSLAEENARRVLELSPGNTTAFCILGAMQSGLGRYESAAELYRRALEFDANCSEAYHGLVEARVALSADERQHLQNLCDGDEVAREAKVNLLYALFKQLESEGNYSTAFNYLLEANKLVSERRYYSGRRTSKMINTLRATMDARLFKEPRQRPGYDITPIFIVGMPRSGTTLTEQILSRHSQVYGAGELYEIRNLAEELHPVISGRDYRESGKLDQDRLDELAERYIRSIRAKSDGSPFVTDKMPQNFLHIGTIKLLFPNALIIHCKRDPVATCLSAFRSNYTEGHDYSYDMQNLGEYYLEYQGLMDYWDDLFGEQLFSLNYEHLVEDPAAEVERLLGYCGLAFEEACLAPHESERPIHTASHAQVRQPIYKGASDKWRRYEDQLQPLLQTLKQH